MLATIHLKRTKDRQPSKKMKKVQKFKAGDPVLLKNYIKKNKTRMLSPFPAVTFVKSSMIELMIYKTPLVMLDVLL